MEPESVEVRRALSKNIVNAAGPYFCRAIGDLGIPINYLPAFTGQASVTCDLVGDHYEVNIRWPRGEQTR